MCIEALGMQNKQIPDSAITASSYGYSGIKAHNGRLHFLYKSSHVVGGWVARWIDQNPFFQVHFGDWRKVTRVAIQGRQDSDEWVESFSLSYGYDSVFFQDYTEEGVKKVRKSKQNSLVISNTINYKYSVCFIPSSLPLEDRRLDFQPLFGKRARASLFGEERRPDTRERRKFEPRRSMISKKFVGRSRF